MPLVYQRTTATRNEQKRPSYGQHGVNSFPLLLRARARGMVRKERAAFRFALSSPRAEVIGQLLDLRPRLGRLWGVFAWPKTSYGTINRKETTLGTLSPDVPKRLVRLDYSAEVVQHADLCPVRARERAILRVRDRVTDRVWPCIPDRAVSKPIVD
jgi:hypothetical protein